MNPKLLLLLLIVSVTLTYPIVSLMVIGVLGEPSTVYYIMEKKESEKNNE